MCRENPVAAAGIDIVNARMGMRGALELFTLICTRKISHLQLTMHTLLSSASSTKNRWSPANNFFPWLRNAIATLVVHEVS